MGVALLGVVFAIAALVLLILLDQEKVKQMHRDLGRHNEMQGKGLPCSSDCEICHPSA